MASDIPVVDLATLNRIASQIRVRDIQSQLPDGVAIYQIHTHDVNGKAVADQAPSPDALLQPGDAVELRGGGKTWLTHVAPDGTDIAEPTETSTPTANKNPDVRNFGTSDNPDWRQYNPDTQAFEKMQGVGPQGPSPKDVQANAKLIAMARGALQKAQAGKTPTQAELAAYDQVKYDPQLSAQMTSGGAAIGGQAGQATTAAVAAGADPVDLARARTQLGSQDYLNLCEKFVEQVTTGKTGQYPSAISAWNAQQGQQQTNFDNIAPGDKVYYGAADENGGNGHVGIYSGDGKIISATSAGVKELPTNAFQAPLLGYIKNGDGTPGGLPGGLPDITLPGAKPALHSVAPGSTLVDENGNVVYQGAPSALQQAQLAKAQQDLLPKAQLALSQQYDTLKYIKQQIAAGNISPAEATSYYASVKAQTQAQLAGTTPFAIYKQQQDFEDKQATNAKSLLDTQVTASGSLVDNLLKNLQPDSKVPPLVASSVPFDINSVMGTAQNNIQRYIPQELTDSAQRLLSSFYGPQPAAPGATDGSGMPLNMPPPIDDTSDQTQPAAAAA